MFLLLADLVLCVSISSCFYLRFFGCFVYGIFVNLKKEEVKESLLFWKSYP